MAPEVSFGRNDSSSSSASSSSFSNAAAAVPSWWSSCCCSLTRTGATGRGAIQAGGNAGESAGGEWGEG